MLFDYQLFKGSIFINKLLNGDVTDLISASELFIYCEVTELIIQHSHSVANRAYAVVDKDIIQYRVFSAADRLCVYKTGLLLFVYELHVPILIDHGL